MDHPERWIFTRKELEETPSRRCGVDFAKEVSYRRQAADFIQHLGQRLDLTQLCINTAVMYIHRFYMLHSFRKVDRHVMSVAALFLAAKVEEQPRKMEHLVCIAHSSLHKANMDMKSVLYQQKRDELQFLEEMLVETLGFDVVIEHPHVFVLEHLQRMKAPKEVTETAYFMATNSMHVTTVCLMHPPTVVACMCINIACKLAKYDIQPSSEGTPWFAYIDKSLTPELLQQLTEDFTPVLRNSTKRLSRPFYPHNKTNGQSSRSLFRVEPTGCNSSQQ